MLLEGKLIKDFQPRYNVSFRDDKRFLLLKVNLQDPVPRFTLTRLRTADGARYFGPFAHSGALRNTLMLIRRQFNLRGCRPLTPTEADYKHCLYGNLKCSARPCIGNVTREQYLEQVEAACNFLDGQCGEMAGQMEVEMKKAALAQDYEKAAQLRDALQDLKRTTHKTEKFERIPYTLPLALDPTRDLEELGRVLGLAAPPARSEGFDISNISGTFVVASMVSFKHGRPDRANYRRFKMKGVTADDFRAWRKRSGGVTSRLLRERSPLPGACRHGGEAGEPADSEDDESEPRHRRGVAHPDGEATRSSAPGRTGPRPAGPDPDRRRQGASSTPRSPSCQAGHRRHPGDWLAKEFEEIYRPAKANRSASATRRAR
jgi:excinuclease ABC subunit C